jgi:hypothetical protein
MAPGGIRKTEIPGLSLPVAGPSRKQLKRTLSRWRDEQSDTQFMWACPGSFKAAACRRKIRAA